MGEWVRGPWFKSSIYRYLDIFLVVQSSTPPLRWVNSQLISLQPVEVLNSLCCICTICFIIHSENNEHNIAKYTRHLNKFIYHLFLFS